jgi:hypothetical protein
VRREEHVRARATRLGKPRERVDERGGKRVDEHRFDAPVRGAAKRGRLGARLGELAGHALHLAGVDVPAVGRERHDRELAAPRARNLGEHVLGERVPEAHGHVHARADPRLDRASEVARDREQGRAADGLVAAADLVHELGRARAAAPDVREKPGQIVEVLDGPVAEQKDFAERHDQNEKVAFTLANMTVDL